MDNKLLAEAVAAHSLYRIVLNDCALGLHEKASSAYVDARDELSMQIRHEPVDWSVFDALDQASGEQTHFLRYRYRCVARVIDSSLQEGEPLYELFTYNTVFALEYQLVNDMPSHEAIDEFAYYNLPFHIWSYWREHLHSSLSRCGLPVFTLPMFKSGSLPERKDVLTREPIESSDTAPSDSH